MINHAKTLGKNQSNDQVVFIRVKLGMSKFNYFVIVYNGMILCFVFAAAGVLNFVKVSKSNVFDNESWEPPPNHRF